MSRCIGFCRFINFAVADARTYVSISEYYSSAPRSLRFFLLRFRLLFVTTTTAIALNSNGARLSATTKSISIINLKMDLENSIELFLFHPNAIDSIPNMLLTAAAAAFIVVLFSRFCCFFSAFDVRLPFSRILNFISVAYSNVYQTISEIRTKIGLWTHSNILWKLLESLVSKHTSDCVFLLSANQKQRR